MELASAKKTPNLARDHAESTTSARRGKKVVLADDFPARDFGEWPEGLTLSREEICDDRG